MNTPLFQNNLQRLNPTLIALKHVYAAAMYPAQPVKPTASANGSKPEAGDEKLAGSARHSRIQGL